MKPDEMSIRVRERSLIELFDLGVLVARRHLPILLSCWLLLGVPLAFFDVWLLTVVWKLRPENCFYPALLLFALQVPLVVAPLCLHLGEAMFNRQASKRRAWRQARQALPGRLLHGLLLTLASLLIVTLPLVPRHLHEVSLLERPADWLTGWRRAWRLSRYNGGQDLATLILHLLAALTLATALGQGLIACIKILQLMNPDRLQSIVEDPHVLLTSGLIFGFGYCLYARVVDFVGYLDLRGKREGWELELALRGAGEALARGELR